MILERFYDEALSQASYLVADEGTKQAVVIDPGLDYARIMEAAARRSLSIKHVTETHVHADFLSGAAALAGKAGATLHLSAEGPAEWGYDFDRIGEEAKLREGDVIALGNVRIIARHTPGHTPEHLAFLVVDDSRGRDPVGAFTGDFLFVGDVGRPDLLEKSAGATGASEGTARELYASLKAFTSLPDHLQIWPGHGAGSACGKSLGAMPASTLGYEKLFNWALAEMTEEAFMRRVLEDQPVPPRYFTEMKKQNRLAGATGDAGPISELSLSALQAALGGGATVVDTRPAAEFAAGHIAGTINIPVNKSFLNWMGALVPYDKDLLLILAADADPAEIAAQLAKIGLTSITGRFGPDVVAEWEQGGRALQKTAQMDMATLASKRETRDVQVLDVRAPHEWNGGHIPGARHIPLASLQEQLSEIDAGVPVAVHCKGGGRSSIAASVLQAAGISSVFNFSPGYDGWTAGGGEVTT